MNPTTLKILRWLARGLSSFAGAYWLFMLVGESIHPSVLISLEGTLLAVLIIIATIGTIISWCKEKIGGAILLIAGLALAIFAYITAGHNKCFAVLVSAGPFLITAILFLVIQQKSKTS